MEYSSDTEILPAARRLVMLCGVHADLKGFNCLADAVALRHDGTESVCEIYSAIAAARGLKSKSVMRLISYAISKADGIGARLSQMLGAPLREMDIHSGLVIASLAALLKDKEKNGQ